MGGEGTSNDIAMKKLVYISFFFGIIAVALWVLISSGSVWYVKNQFDSASGSNENTTLVPNEKIGINRSRADEAVIKMDALISGVNEKISRENTPGNDKKAEVDELRAKVNHIRESASRAK